MSSKDGDDWILAGIVSFGPKVCAITGFEDRPAIFTNINYFLPWVHSNAI